MVLGGQVAPGQVVEIGAREPLDRGGVGLDIGQTLFDGGPDEDTCGDVAVMRGALLQTTLVWRKGAAGTLLTALLEDTSGVEASVAGAPAVVRWMLVGTAAIWVLLELRQSLTHRAEGVQANGGSEVHFRLIVGGGALVAGVLAGLAPSATIRPAAVEVGLGLVLFWGGIALRLWSFRTLGRYFTLTVQTSRDQPVMTAGPYRVIRHPSYAGLLLVFMAGGLVLRIRVEERALLLTLGEGYRAYAATHKRLVPFIW